MIENTSLYDAFLACRNATEVKIFIKDLLSPEEIERAEDRWSIALKHLTNPKLFTQSKLKQLGYGSSDKIGRIVRPITSQESGYRIVFERLRENYKNDSIGEAP